VGEGGRELPLAGEEGRVVGLGGLVGLPLGVAGFWHSLYPHLWMLRMVLVVVTGRRGCRDGNRSLELTVTW